MRHAHLRAPSYAHPLPHPTLNTFIPLPPSVTASNLTSSLVAASPYRPITSMDELHRLGDLQAWPVSSLSEPHRRPAAGIPLPVEPLAVHDGRSTIRVAVRAVAFRGGVPRQKVHQVEVDVATRAAGGPAW